MTEDSSHPNAGLYCELMEYIKWRVEAVMKTAHLVMTGKHHLDNRLAAEFCLLQLRFCCELLAVGCVAIHTDVPQTKRLRSHWNAERIMSAFSKMKPRFFPEPVSSKKMPDGTFDQKPVHGALTKDELTAQYAFFGRLLHTGNYVTYKQEVTETFDFGLLTDSVDKLRRLLNEHVYFLYEENKMIRVIMHNAKDGRVWLNELKLIRTPSAPSPPPPDHT